MGLVSGKESGMSSETRRLLAFRLTVVAGVFAFSSGLYALRSILLPESEGICLHQQLIALAIFLVSGFLLHRNQDLPLKTLRFFEILIFGAMALHLFRYYYLWTSVQGDSGASLAIYRAALSYFAIMVVYGMFIPNHWRRALAGVSLIGIVPVILTVAVWLTYPNARAALAPALTPDLISDTGLLLFIGALVAAFGSHIIHNTRLNAARAREMGMYQLEKRIGKGGMGEVWKAEHELLARPAAIKLIRPEVLSSGNGDGLNSVIPRFKREAQITANLRSPHTVELYDFGVTDSGVFYYVMEYLDGLDLESLIERFGPQPAERVIYLLQQSAESLAEAHQMGLVHRDIKPSNLYISRMGVRADFLKVLDFGLVKSQSSLGMDETKLTAEGTTTGTPAFMAPEMALGKGTVDSRSDIYALGCVAYWLLTGSLVFQGETPMEIVVNHVKTEPVPPSQKTELPIPEGLDNTIMACLAKDPDQRPQSVMELSRMLEQCKLELPWNQTQAIGWWDSHIPQQQAS
jgi:serine/threonine-protein kinase